MKLKIKKIVKKFLILIGLMNPANGVKISQARKAEILLSYKTPSTDIFIETGTYQGDMIKMLKAHFKEIYSVELDNNLYNASVRRFQSENNIFLYHGDSAQELHKILKKIVSPALIWLDAHASGDINFENSPVEAELQAIFNYSVKGSIVLIDDARHFNMSDIRKIKKIARANKYSFVTDEGVFRLTSNI